MNRHWASQGERGSVFAMKLISWIAFTFGRNVSRLLLYPICLYFMLLVQRSTRASRQYLARALGRPPTWHDVFRHYHTFASVLLDRAFVLAGRNPDLVVEGERLVGMVSIGDIVKHRLAEIEAEHRALRDYIATA